MDLWQTYRWGFARQACVYRVVGHCDGRGVVGWRGGAPRGDRVESAILPPLSGVRGFQFLLAKRVVQQRAVYRNHPPEQAFVLLVGRYTQVSYAPFDLLPVVIIVGNELVHSVSYGNRRTAMSHAVVSVPVAQIH